MNTVVDEELFFAHSPDFLRLPIVRPAPKPQPSDRRIFKRNSLLRRASRERATNLQQLDIWKRVAASSRKDANITSNDVANFEISVPVLESEQTEITIALDAVEEILAGSGRSLQKLRAHKAALMQQLFPSIDELDGPTK